MSESANAPTPVRSNGDNEVDIPFWRKILYTALVFGVFLVLLEGVVRVGYFAANGFSTYYLTFGFVADIERHSAEFDGYTKFQPNTTYRYVVNRDVSFSMGINGNGFRGEYDFAAPKPEQTVRVAAMGESSTFGLASQDDETYPYLLEQQLRQELGTPVEVLNLGIPHYRTNHILALARAELAALQPDIVTLYAGYNNSMMTRPEQGNSVLGAKDWLKHHVVTYRALHPYVASAYRTVSSALGRDVVGIATLSLAVDVPETEVTRLRENARAEFARDLAALADEVEAMGARLVLITQSYTIRRLPAHGLTDRWRPYAEEVAHVDSLLQANGAIPAPFSTLLIHNDLMNDLRAFAATRNLQLIDGIAALDADRERVMATYVHLTREGNVRLADAIADSVREPLRLIAAQRAAGARHTAQAR